MSELVDFYTKQHTALAPNVQHAAIADLVRLGFPTRQDEDWKYTSTAAWAKQLFACSLPASMPSPLPPELAALQLSAFDVPPGVIVSAWADALRLHAELIQPYLDQLVVRTHGFQAQNTAMLQDGLFIYIPAGVKLTQPLCIAPPPIAHHTARYLRYLIITEADSAVSLIEDYSGFPEQTYFTNTLTEILVGPRAHVRHYKLQREGLSAFHVGQLAARLLANSELECHSVSLGGHWVRSDTTIEFAAEGASCRLNGIYLTSGLQHLDHHTRVKHTVPNCVSTQDYRGVLSGRSRAVFNGSVVVAPQAQHSEAKQQNKNLLLSSQAEVDTKPQLEIFADDVQCSHGATVGQLNDDALFYLVTRGIPMQEARQLLLDAFLCENLAQLALTPLANWMSQLIQQRTW